ncbi:cytochrome P450 [Bimuria novae-zelandiae CBS 107.79]|uniref:Cytochrome P450 n=1 Tax=Bimuria novae-zelandiae CBS 107.79 TaxID=1447943 RepID=A0A6A5UUN1_9PLEO|nr:cytochrome P450 [Bimuria novae-zelandiae CBS 107.79]
MKIDIKSWLLCGLITVSLYWCWLLPLVYAVIVLRRLYFHPLSTCPGTKLSIAFPTLYKLYRSFRRRGQFLFEIEELHRRYGPVVRFGINDLHVNDLQVYLGITKIGSRFRKDPRFYDRISFRNTSLGFLDPYKHGARHTVLVNAAFSPRNIHDLADRIERKVAKLMNRLEEETVGGQPVSIHKCMKALSMDIISEITMGQNVFLEQLHTIFKETSWIQKILFTELAKPPIREYLERRNDSPANGELSDRAIVIDALTSTPISKGGASIDFETLSEEVGTLLTAGGDTVSSTMIFGIYQICRNEEMYKTLRQELMDNLPMDASITYERETLRTSNPLPGRLPRVVPPEPSKFDPSRWLLPNSKKLEQYMTSFYRETRQCLGQE